MHSNDSHLYFCTKALTNQTENYIPMYTFKNMHINEHLLTVSGKNVLYSQTASQGFHGVDRRIRDSRGRAA